MPSSAGSKASSPRWPVGRSSLSQRRAFWCPKRWRKWTSQEENPARRGGFLKRGTVEVPAMNHPVKEGGIRRGKGHQPVVAVRGAENEPASGPQQAPDVAQKCQRVTDVLNDRERGRKVDFSLESGKGVLGVGKDRIPAPFQFRRGRQRSAPRRPAFFATPSTAFKKLPPPHPMSAMVLAAKIDAGCHLPVARQVGVVASGDRHRFLRFRPPVRGRRRFHNRPARRDTSRCRNRRIATRFRRRASGPGIFRRESAAVKGLTPGGAAHEARLILWNLVQFLPDSIRDFSTGQFVLIEKKIRPQEIDFGCRC